MPLTLPVTHDAQNYLVQADQAARMMASEVFHVDWEAMEHKLAVLLEPKAFTWLDPTLALEPRKVRPRKRQRRWLRDQ